MKKRAKPWQFFLPAILILVFAYLALFGLSRQTDNGSVTYVKGASDIRFGIDIKGGVDVTFMVADGTDATDEQLDAAESVIQQRLVGLNASPGRPGRPSSTPKPPLTRSAPPPT